jgi:GNAT superfamily N-acetyltransferase
MAVGTEINVRLMLRNELELILDWAAAEGWNPGLFDAEAFFDADPNGFFIAECDGRPVGSFSAVAYDEQFGFAGLFIVLPEYRGGRCGVELGRRGVEYLGSRTIGLDGVKAKQENYYRLGFSRAYWTIRHRGVAPCNTHLAADSPAQIENLRDISFDIVSDFDAALFPARRESFLRTWINQPGHTALGVIQQDRLTGYGVIRPCRFGYKIGPLMAKEACVAETLLDALLTTIPSSEFYIDVPEPNEPAMAMVRRRSMSPIFETARMYRGVVPQIDLNQIFGVTTLELG